MKFVKQDFMGVELDILVGHPEHDLLFIATQVARAAGLKNPSSATYEARKTHENTLSMWDVTYDKTIGSIVLDAPRCGSGRRYKETTGLFTESQTYQMLLRGHAPASEPFRKWVTEVVLPTIRKTGKFDVNEAQDQTSQDFAGQFAALHAEMADLKAMLKELLERPVASLEPSPYEGTTMSTLSDALLFDKRTFREVGESIGVTRPGIDKLEPYVLLCMEVALGKLWADEDGRPLKEHLSSTKRKWTKWPSKWVKSKMDRDFYRQVLRQVVNERMASI